MADALACDNAEKGRRRRSPCYKANPRAHWAKLYPRSHRSGAERVRQQMEGFRLAVEMKALLKQIAAAQGPGPAEAAVTKLLEKVQNPLKQANGAAKLAGLRELADQTDTLLQIELTNSAADASGAAAATPPAEQDSVKAKGEALVRLASAGAPHSTPIEAKRRRPGRKH